MNGEGTSEDPYKITDVRELQKVKRDLNAHYELVTNIDASDTKNWNNGEGFNPIGNTFNRFKGSIEGKGNKIKNLFIKKPERYDVGLFGCCDDAEIDNIKLLNTKVEGNRRVGCISGKSIRSKIRDCYVGGKIRGRYRIGGVVGYNKGLIENVYSTAYINSMSYKYSGGITCYNKGEIVNTGCTGHAEKDKYFGYISGINSGEIRDCWSIIRDDSFSNIINDISKEKTVKNISSVKLDKKSDNHKILDSDVKIKLENLEIIYSLSKKLLVVKDISKREIIENVSPATVQNIINIYSDSICKITNEFKSEVLSI